MAPAETYSDLTPEELIALLVARSDVFTTSHKEQQIPVVRVDVHYEMDDEAVEGYDPSNNYFEQFPIQLDENVILSGVGDEAVEEYEEHGISLSSQNIPNADNSQASNQFSQSILQTDPTGTMTTIKDVPGRRFSTQQ